jgi:hypothetical protein
MDLLVLYFLAGVGATCACVAEYLGGTLKTLLMSLLLVYTSVVIIYVDITSQLSYSSVCVPIRT